MLLGALPFLTGRESPCCEEVGLLLGLIGMAGSALGVVDPNPVAPVINTGEHAGLLFIGAGMLLWGIVAVRTRAFGRWSVLPHPYSNLHNGWPSEGLRAPCILSFK
jgi:hypothetical protein